MRTSILLGLLFALLSGCSSDTPAVDSAEAAAQAFLDLIDDGDYAQTWSEASPWLKEHVEAEEWAVHAGNYRRPLGNVSDRSLQSVEYDDAPEDMPAGEYAFVVFDTSLEDDASATELVGLMLDRESKWRVIGYHTL